MNPSRQHHAPGSSPRAGSARPDRTVSDSRGDARHPRAAASRGVTLIECLVYIAVLSVVLAVGGAVYARVLDHTRQVRRVAGDISRVINAGEQWRADVRAATTPRLVEEAGLQALHLPRTGGGVEVVYFFDGSNVVRRAGADAAWQPFLARVKAARFVADPRPHASAWRWEVELVPGPHAPRMRPLFTFLAVAGPATP
jgi:prepilin-type N-terminal cleavage/methylation domain-containing protein